MRILEMNQRGPNLIHVNKRRLYAPNNKMINKDGGQSARVTTTIRGDDDSNSLAPEDLDDDKDSFFDDSQAVRIQNNIGRIIDQGEGSETSVRRNTSKRLIN